MNIENFNYKKLYTDVPKAKNRFKKTLTEFQKHFGQIIDYNKPLSVISAPGRTEIGGNHTDHQHGCVLAAAINLDVLTFAIPNNSNTINLYSDGFGISKINLNNLKPANDKNDTQALIKGIATYFVKKGYKIGGFNAYLTSNVIVGSGLSSSAAFEIAVGGVLNFLFNKNSISPIELAIAGQFAENNFMNKASGLMDQTASAVGGFVSIDFKNPTKPIIKPIQYDLTKADYALCVVDVNASHANLTTAYSQIPREMKMVANYFKKDVLRDVNEKKFWDNIAKIRLKTGDRPVLRAIHFFGENQRALNEAKLLENNNLDEFLLEVRASGNSSYKYLQNIYADINQQAVSLALAASEKILYENNRQKTAVRVHGGGFAGTILAFVPQDLLEIYKTKIEKILGAKSCHILQIRNTGYWAQWLN
ncbi:MAG: hypothetical protein LBT99_03180 [Bifidobacteriaceae bacterium]|jgi:galactokinase|nr:hypothetical protein [Bifidobacteriaceae bacterium]